MTVNALIATARISVIIREEPVISTNYPLIALIVPQAIFTPLPIDDALVRIAKGEVLDDSWSRLIYSVDASHYQIMPEAAVCPVDDQDVQNVCEFCSSKQIPVAPRGSGTGLLGQSLSDGVILDFTKHMNKILEIGNDYVITQPGVVKAVLERELIRRGKFLPPDPASSNYCTIGGMIANNSSGIHCLGYGNTIDFLEGVKLVYSDGTKGYADDKNYDVKMEKFKSYLRPEMDLVFSSFPKVSKNSCGYRLDSVLESGNFHPQKLFAASEGTLGIVTEARFRILDLPDHRCLLVLGFTDLMRAIAAVPSILGFSPVALEMMDQSVISLGKEQQGSGCVLFVEFAGSTPAAERQFTSCMESMKEKCSVLEYASDETSLDRIWGARKGALNNIMKLTIGSRKPIGLIEDTVVRPENLSGHVSGLVQEYRANKMDYVMYGHVGDGNVHTRPLVDLESSNQVRLINELARRVFQRVTGSGGTITGEHGDGISRLPFIEMVYGSATMELFYQTKKMLDPQNILNPGKKVPASKLE